MIAGEKLGVPTVAAAREFRGPSSNSEKLIRGRFFLPCFFFGAGGGSFKEVGTTTKFGIKLIEKRVGGGGRSNPKLCQITIKKSLFLSL